MYICLLTTHLCIFVYGQPIYVYLFIDNPFMYMCILSTHLFIFVYWQGCYVASDYKESKSQCDKDPESFRHNIELSQFNLPDGAHRFVLLNLHDMNSSNINIVTILRQLDHFLLVPRVAFTVQHNICFFVGIQ